MESNDDTKKRRNNALLDSFASTKKQNKASNNNARPEIEAKVLPLQFDDDSDGQNKDYLQHSPILLRHVMPYPYTFSTHCKARWTGRTLLDVYTTEFLSHSDSDSAQSYYKLAIQQGRIQVSHQTVSPNYVLKNHDLLTHTVHRHEPAVAVDQVDPPHVNVIAETESLIVVNKPGTMPVHPCGGYHYNSLINILEPTYGKLYNSNRLDRLTSGLVILGKTSQAAQAWATAIKKHECKKYYLARVKGRFPSLQILSRNNLKQLSGPEIPSDSGEWNPLNQDSTAVGLRRNHAHCYWITSDGVVVESNNKNNNNNNNNNYKLFDSATEVQDWSDKLEKCSDFELDNLVWLHLCCPTRVEHPKDGICKCGIFEDLSDELYCKTVKPAHTSFTFLYYDLKTDTSLVLCQPKTGRTHQVRLHLEYLQHPIANDPNYGGDMWYANNVGHLMCEKGQTKLDSMNANMPQIKSSVSDQPLDKKSDNVSPDEPGKTDAIETLLENACIWCRQCNGEPLQRGMIEFSLRSPGIWLHAYKYCIPVDGDSGSQSFTTKLPSWAILRTS